MGCDFVEIKNYEDKYLVSLNELLQKCFKVERKCDVLDSDVEVLAVTDDKVVGYLVLNYLYDSLKDKKYYHVNYVCTDPEYRNQGIAKEMFSYVFQLCIKNDISYLELTSRPSRVAAQGLYRKLGFVERETTVFRKEIK